MLTPKDVLYMEDILDQTLVLNKRVANDITMIQSEDVKTRHYWLSWKVRQNNMADKSKSYGDKDIATNLLVTLKHMKAELNTFTQEASNDELFTKIDEVYTCVSTLQRDVFNMMTAQGWYKMTAESAKNISKAYTKFSKSESELS